jgi:hypothetical protein
MSVVMLQSPQSPKACEACERVAIGRTFTQVGLVRSRFGFLLIYLAILGFLPLLLFGLVMYWHLKVIGAQNVKTFYDFLPQRASFRYNHQSQIVFDKSSPLLRRKFFWIFNCSYYCPYSVALLEWMTYLAKIVENWWCPFAHGKKIDYAAGSIDRSFWHVFPSEAAKLHPDDLTNPIWNDGSPERSRTS